MPSLSATWIATLALLAALGGAISFEGTNTSLPSTAILNLTVWHGPTQLPIYRVVSIYGATQNYSFTGPLILGNEAQGGNNSNIVLVSCDQNDYPGLQKLQNVYNYFSAQGSTIIMYSNTANWCHIGDTTGFNNKYLFSMTVAQDSAALANAVKTTGTPLFARIGMENGTSTSSDGTNTGNSTSMWYAPGTALAMIILYAITGCITFLFILIIITGTIRAHRHPERYGRRVVGGRTRQTRVGGLARAMLETLPIVKFGDKPEENKDVEMVASSATPSPSKAPATEVTEKALDDGIAPAAGSATSENLPGCSICTEDFEIGQDQRVLPCEHRFHPACIDPWLLNVSGTCPLCRVDLRPPEEPEQNEEDEESPPEPVPPASRRRSVLLAITNLRQPGGMSRDERIEALRRYRHRGVASASTTEETAVQSEPEQTGRSAQLRRLFNVRTWRTTRSTAATTSAQPSAVSSPSPISTQT